MRGFKEFLQVILILTIHCLISHGVNTTTINDGSVSKNNNFEQTSKVGWIFHDESSLRRTKRNVIQNSVNNKQEKNHNLFDDRSKCFFFVYSLCYDFGFLHFVICYIEVALMSRKC